MRPFNIVPSPHRAHVINLVCTYMENNMAYEDSTGQDVNACSVNVSLLLSIYVDVCACVCVCLCVCVCTHMYQTHKYGTTHPQDRLLT